MEKSEVERSELEHWDKVVAFVKEAAVDEEMQEILRNGPESEILGLLLEHDFELEDIQQVMVDLEKITPLADTVWWYWHAPPDETLLG